MASLPKLSIRLLKDEDEQKLLDLLRKFIPSWSNRSYKHWLWQYKNNPFGHYTVVASYGGQIVGAHPTTSFRVKIGNLVVNCSQPTDAIVDPRFRRRGIFFSMLKFFGEIARRKNIEMRYGFPDKPARVGALKSGFFDICKVPVLVKILNTRNAVSLLSLRWKTHILTNKIFKNIANYLFILFATLRWSPSIFRKAKSNQRIWGIKIEQIKFFDKRFDIFWKKVSNDYQILVVRDTKYLNWRFFEKPDGKYEVFSAEMDQQILGYIVLASMSRDVYKVGYIVDLLVPLNEPRLTQKLLLAALDYFKRENVDSVICLMSKYCPSFKVLKSYGFFQAKSVILVGQLYTSRVSVKFVRNCENWYITMGDSDFI